MELTPGTDHPMTGESSGFSGETVREYGSTTGAMPLLISVLMSVPFLELAAIDPYIPSLRLAIASVTRS